MITANKALLNVLVNMVDGSTRHITEVNDKGYKVIGRRKLIPVNMLLRVKDSFEEIDPTDKKRDRVVVLDEGYGMILSHSETKEVKSGKKFVPANLDKVARFDKNAALAKKAVPVSIKTGKPKAPKTTKVETPKIEPKKEPVLIDIPAFSDRKQSSGADRMKENQTNAIETLQLAYAAAASNKKSLREFETVVAASLSIPVTKVPKTAHEIMDTFGLVKTRKVIDALRKYFQSRDAKASMPIALRNLKESKRIQLTPAQKKVIITALAPNVHPGTLDYVIDEFDFGAMFIEIKPFKPSKEIKTAKVTRLEEKK